MTFMKFMDVRVFFVQRLQNFMFQGVTRMMWAMLLYKVLPVQPKLGSVGGAWRRRRSLCTDLMHVFYPSQCHLETVNRGKEKR